MIDVLVIGAGQAGLATCWALRPASLRVELVDAAGRIGDGWRRRHDSLTLFSPRAASALPGLALPGDPQGYPTKDEVADYLETYAGWLSARVRLRSAVRRLSFREGLFRAEVRGGEPVAARAVVIASGAFQEPVVPAFALALSPDVVQLTADTYRNPGHVPGGRVLVAGDGATGRQVALELAGSREVWLATGRPRLVVAQRVLGRDQLWWSERLGILRASRESVVGRLLRRYEPFPGGHLRLGSLRRRGVRIAGRVTGARGRRVAFADGTSLDVDAIVWAIGYRERWDWVDVPGAKDAGGRLVERRGVSPVPGLYVVGRDWQWSRGSALLTGVARDARFVADRIRAQLALAPAPGEATSAEPRASRAEPSLSR